MANCRSWFFLLALTLFVSVPARQTLGTESDADRRPNVVLIMTDNHGAWTLGCYGNRDIRTPNIDRLAAEGTLFTQAFSSNPVCSPTRATFLTGLMPSQHGVHCFLTGGRLQVGPEARCTLDEVTSLPEVLRDAGYACGLVGKWHLGDNLRPQEGLDDYWITMPHGATSTFYDAPIIEDGKIRKEPEYLTDFWTRHAVRFIEQQGESEQPFFLFLSYNGPYSLGRLLLREGQNRHAAYYADKELSSFPREPTHPWQYNNRDYHNHPVSIRRVATEVSGVDDGVGTVMRTLREAGLDDDTVVIFVADQGWVGGQGGFFGMGDHTRPVTARDGMMKIPMIWRHPGGIRSGVRTDAMVTNYDLMPTLLSYLNLADRMPSKPKSPGIDFVDQLSNRADPPSGDSNTSRPVFYEFESLRCIRTERWKYVHRHPNGPHELYDLGIDPDEFNNLFGVKEHAEVTESLKRQLDDFFDQHSEDRYDLWEGGGSQTRLFVGIDEEQSQLDTAQAPPTPPDFEPSPLEVPDGFTVELVAGPPLVTHPTLGCLDDRGRLFICNNAGVNLSAAELEEQLPNSIRMLEDRDGDGRYDRSTVFADKMTYPMGGAWHDGALYVASPPYIWRLEDTDGDGVADRRDPIVKEFGYTGNAASIHGCFFGPDGRLYWCDGYHGHEFKDADGRITSKREGSYLFSCQTDGSDVRIHCGGGMDNPVEVDFTDEGEMIGSVNILYSRPRVDALVHWLYGGAYPHRERVLDEIKVTGDLLEPIHRFGHVAVSGMMRYRSGVMDHRWKDDVFATFFNSGKVVRVSLEREGASYRATQREFLSSSRRDFHPTDVIEDADGSLLVVDTGGWFYRGCPTSQMAKPDILGGIYRVRRTGMTPQVDPWGTRIDWNRLSDPELVKLLNDTRHKVRERAIRECAQRAATIVPALTRSLRSDLRVRMGSLWALTRLIGDDPSNEPAREAVRAALRDADERVRHVACRSIATYPDDAAVVPLSNVLLNDEPAVRREAAKALGRIGNRGAMPALIEALGRERPIDRSEEHAIIYAMIELADTEALKAGLVHESAKVRRACLTVLEQTQGAAVDPMIVVEMLGAEDEALRNTAGKSLVRSATTINGDQEPRASRSELSSAVAMYLRRWISDSDVFSGRRDLIVDLAAAFAGTKPVAEVIGRSLDRSTAPEVRDAMLEVVARTRGLATRNEWEAALNSLLDAEDPGLIGRAINAVAALQTESFDSRLKMISENERLPASVRVPALVALQDNQAAIHDGTFGILLQMLEAGVPGEAELASRVLASSRLSVSQRRQLVDVLSDLGPASLRDLIRLYGGVRDPETGQAFLQALESARSFEQLPTNEVSDVIKRFPESLLPRANRLLDRLIQLDQRRVEKLDRLIPLVESASVARGREIFFAEKSKCATCHRVGKEGGEIGPDLTTIGLNRSHQDLLESIVFPSASIVRQYESYTLLTTNGQVYNGMVTRRTGDTVWVQQQTGEPIEIKRDEVESLVPNPVSVMPKGLDAELGEQDLADLVAWLKTLGR